MSAKPDERMTLGIVTVTYKSAEVLPDFIASLLGQQYRSWILYAVDNNSQDATQEVLLEARDPRIVVRCLETNVGIAAGNNVGISMALADGCSYVLLINNDTIFGPSLLNALVDEARVCGAPIIVPKMRYHDPPNRIWYGGGALHVWRAYAASHAGIGRIDHGEFDQPRQIDYAPTTCMLIRRRELEALGGMDERFWLYCDDTDFCIRAKQAGVRMWYVPAAVMEHKVSSLAGPRSPLALRMVTRGRMYLIQKFAPRWEWPFHLTIVIAEMCLRVVLGRDTWKGFRGRWKGMMEAVRSPIQRDSVRAIQSPMRDRINAPQGREGRASDL